MVAHPTSLRGRVVLGTKELIPGEVIPSTAETKVAEESLLTMMQNVGGLDIFVTVPCVVQGLNAQDDRAHDTSDLVNAQDRAE